MGFRILGTGSAVPEKILSNDDMTKFFDTSDEWITTRTGIKERHILTNDESLLGLASCAAKKALEAAKVKAEELDLIVCSTVHGDYISPSMSCLILGEIGARNNCLTLDVNLACCGFIYALNVANTFLNSGTIRRALVVSAEGLSRLIDWTDRSTAVLFGDASGAVVLERSDSEVYFDHFIKPNPEYLRIDRVKDNCPLRSCDLKSTVKMNGQEVYKFASAAIFDRINGVLEKAGLKVEDVDKFLLHQANIRIIESSLHRLKMTDEKFPHNIEKYGNNSSASLPLLLDEQVRAGNIPRGEKVILCAFGAGFSSIACLFTM